MPYYNRGKLITMDPNTASGLGETPLDLLTDRIVVPLMSTSYTPNIDTDEQFDDIVANEITATGYVSRGDGLTLASKAITVDNTNDQAEFDAADLTFTAIGNGTNDTISYCVIAREQDAGATNANTELLAYMDVDNTVTNGGNVTLSWNADGILQIGV